MPIPSCRRTWCAPLVRRGDEDRAVLIVVGGSSHGTPVGIPLRPDRRDGVLLLAGALIADADGRVLLLHRNTPENSWWEVPGGKVEEGEEAWETALRELAEELSVRVELVAEIGTEQFNQGDQPLEYTWYLARIQSGVPRLVELNRFDAFRYFTWDEVRALADASPSVSCLRERRTEMLRDILSSAENLMWCPSAP